jgi:hypothetical protein
MPLSDSITQNGEAIASVLIEYDGFTESEKSSVDLLVDELTGQDPAALYMLEAFETYAGDSPEYVVSRDVATPHITCTDLSDESGPTDPFDASSWRIVYEEGVVTLEIITREASEVAWNDGDIVVMEHLSLPQVTDRRPFVDLEAEVERLGAEEAIARWVDRFICFDRVDTRREYTVVDGNSSSVIDRFDLYVEARMFASRMT